MRTPHPALPFALLLAIGCGASPPAPRTAVDAHDHTGERQHAGQGHAHGFSDVERFARIFDDPARDEWQKPDEVISMLAAEPGQTAVDLGAGTGYFLARLDAAVGAAGHVLALDVEPAMVAHMEQRIADEGLSRVAAAVCPLDHPGLDASSVDRVLVVDTWHHLSERSVYAARVAEALRPGGSVLVVDFTLDAPFGPPPAMRLTAEAVAAELEGGGLTAEVLEESLPHQYAVRGTKRN